MVCTPLGVIETFLVGVLVGLLAATVLTFWARRRLFS
jgi:hypothetical protein